MTTKDRFATMDGNEAASYVAFNTNEVIALYPITPSSNMGENADAWAAAGKTNLWGTVPKIIEMQSEGGAAGAIHGSLQTGALSTTFTASQGLLLMIPNMFKIAGELTSTVFHVSARAIATHALSIFGDHSDVMAARQCGWAMLASGSVQEAMDCALIAQAATLQARVPFVHFFEGFRISHEISKIIKLTPEEMQQMIDEKLITEHRARALSPDHPSLRGTAQNPDVFFQARERSQPYYDACPDIVQATMDKFAKVTGRQYKLFEYYGAPDADRVVVLIGCASDSVTDAADYLNSNGEKVGLLKVRLYRPFDSKRLFEALPASVKKIAVLDRTKEPGAPGEPLYLDCVSALSQGLAKGWGNLKSMPEIVGGRYGLSSKEFTPAMAKGVFDSMKSGNIKHSFTIGIKDDVSNSSIDYDPSFSTEPADVTRAMFYGLGSDGTVGANKNSIKIIAGETDNYAQGYFEYDSKKAGAITTSHLRFGPKPIQSHYLISQANFVACHQTVFLERYDMLKHLVKGGTFLLNIKTDKDKVWDELPRNVQQQILDKEIKLYVIDAYDVAGATGMGQRINTIMQTCFFAISGVLPKEKAIEAIKGAIVKTYSRKGEEIVKKNLAAVDATLANLHEVTKKGTANGKEMPAAVSKEAPTYVQEVLGEIYAGRGESLPVSAFSPDGTFPTATSRWEKRNIALEIPVWESDLCIQCGKCSFVCPHAAIRIKAYEPKWAQEAPKTFKHVPAKEKDWKAQGYEFTVQVAPEDCTGCGVCVDNCPGKDKANPSRHAINLAEQAPLRTEETANWNFFLKIPNLDRGTLNNTNIRQQQAQEALFEFSGACAGCGETPYVKLLSQLFGDRAVVANATGCSSIYGGNLPTTPWSQNTCGKGPAWSNSLFEDNAEFGLGYRLALDKQKEYATDLLKRLSPDLGDALVNDLINADQSSEALIKAQRDRVQSLKTKLESVKSDDAARLLPVADSLVKKSVWIVGGDGWAYDIGYGGLDHVLFSGQNVNILVLDTEVYSNTGGQMSKSTPRGAVARFAEGGKQYAKKDLGAIAMMSRNVYVASVAMGAKDSHALKAFVEAEAYDGPSIILAYSPCISHGISMTTQLKQQALAVDSGRWLLYRYNPALAAEGKNPLSLDSKKPTVSVEESMMTENRFRQLTKVKPEDAKRLAVSAQKDVDAKWRFFDYLAQET